MKGYQLTLGLLLTTVLCACQPVKPWVKPWERGNLALPIMQADHSAESDAFREHVYSVRGAAKGATGAQGGGCGCN